MPRLSDSVAANREDRSKVAGKETSKNAFRDAPPWVRWVVFLGPIAAFMIVGTILPRLFLGVDASDTPVSKAPHVALWVAIARVVAMLLVIGWAMPRLLKAFPLRVSGLSIAVGLVGGVIWIVLCRLNYEASLLEFIGKPADFFGAREAIDPWLLFPDSMNRGIFLAFRILLLVVAVPIAEELMLRGCLIRAVEVEDWHALPIDQIGRIGLITATVYGVFSHPAEWVAAAVWFSMVTWLMVRTRSFWDCVVAHAVTNAVLGAYILQSGDWRLW